MGLFDGVAKPVAAEVVPPPQVDPVERFVDLLCDLMHAVAVNSDTYGSYYERDQLRKFLRTSGPTWKDRP